MSKNPEIPTLFLSRRNLEVLLSKLDRKAAGEETLCTIFKVQNDKPRYRQTMKFVAVVAVDDDAYYGALDREAGEMLPADEERILAFQRALKASKTPDPNPPDTE